MTSDSCRPGPSPSPGGQLASPLTLLHGGELRAGGTKGEIYLKNKHKEDIHLSQQGRLLGEPHRDQVVAASTPAPHCLNSPHLGQVAHEDISMPGSPRDFAKGDCRR